MAAFVPPQAVAFYNRALAAAEKSEPALAPESAIALHYSRGQALVLMNDWQGSEVAFQSMLKAAREATERTQQGIALHRLAYASQSAFRFTDALAYAEQARLLAVETNDPASLASRLVLARALGDVTVALPHAR